LPLNQIYFLLIINVKISFCKNEELSKTLYRP